ncbi:hypothetical protein V8G54_023696, partial [Vigna mungo]
RSYVTKYLSRVNRLLTGRQKSFIELTSFAWQLSIVVKVKMSKTLLRELCNRWLERRGGIQVRSAFIPFTKLDVCLGLEVKVDGERFKLFKEDVDSHTGRLFDRTDFA